MPRGKKKAAIPKVEEGNTRARNYTDQENVWLARAFSSNNVNTKSGNGMKGDKFWANIAADFAALQQKETPTKDKGCIALRSFDSLREKCCGRRPSRLM
jgi:hypothetical protein